MKRSFIILNIVFIIIFIIFLLLSIFIGTYIGFFFIPILCFLPFAFRKRSGFYKLKEGSKPEIRYCPVCKGVIKEPIAKFCYHCGSKLNNN